MHPAGTFELSQNNEYYESQAVGRKLAAKSVRFSELDLPSSPEASTSSSSGWTSPSDEDEDLHFWSNPTADGVLRDEASWGASLPAPQGLYEPENEKGTASVAFIAFTS